MLRFHRTKKQQNGATAIEFGFVLPIFFLLFYGILSYGLVFLMRLGLQHAAEDGVRAVLHHQQVTYEPNSTAAERRAAQLLARVAVARAVAAQQASWMNRWSVPQIKSNVCDNTVECIPVSGLATYPDCSATTKCQIVISISYPYGSHPVIPNLPGFGLIMPSQLEGRSRTLLDGRAL